MKSNRKYYVIILSLFLWWSYVRLMRFEVYLFVCDLILNDFKSRQIVMVLTISIINWIVVDQWIERLLTNTNDLENRVLNCCEKVHEFSNEAVQAKRDKTIHKREKSVFLCMSFVLQFENVNLLNRDNEGNWCVIYDISIATKRHGIWRRDSKKRS